MVYLDSPYLHFWLGLMHVLDVLHSTRTDNRLSGSPGTPSGRASVAEGLRAAAAAAAGRPIAGSTETAPIEIENRDARPLIQRGRARSGEMKASANYRPLGRSAASFLRTAIRVSVISPSPIAQAVPRIGRIDGGRVHPPHDGVRKTRQNVLGTKPPGLLTIVWTSAS
jgi:hypothetical protein